jgi:hypothetical protein
LPQDCSYSPSPIEQAVVNSVTVGQVYVLLVTNFANVVQTININEAGTNTASTNCAIVPLPVGYTYWNAEHEDNQVLLSWGTEFEDQNRTFRIQRSADGLIWETIGAVAGQNTTNQANHYSYTDVNPLDGISYYRLQQVDLDGAFHLTNVLSISTNVIEPFTVYPNPSKGRFTLQTKTKKSDQILLTDMVGTVQQIALNEVNNGWEVNCSNVAAGVYTLTLISNGNRQTSRIVIEK